MFFLRDIIVHSAKISKYTPFLIFYKTLFSGAQTQRGSLIFMRFFTQKNIGLKKLLYFWPNRLNFETKILPFG